MTTNQKGAARAAKVARLQNRRERAAKRDRRDRKARNGTIAKRFHKDGVAAMDELVQRFRVPHQRAWDKSRVKAANDLARAEREKKQAAQAKARSAAIAKAPGPGVLYASRALKRHEARLEAKRVGGAP